MQWTKLGANNCTGIRGKNPHLFRLASHIFDDENELSNELLHSLP